LKCFFSLLVCYRIIRYILQPNLYTCVNCAQTTGNVSAYKSINETRYKSVCVFSSFYSTQIQSGVNSYTFTRSRNGVLLKIKVNKFEFNIFKAGLTTWQSVYIKNSKWLIVNNLTNKTNKYLKIYIKCLDRKYL